MKYKKRRSRTKLSTLRKVVSLLLCTTPLLAFADRDPYRIQVFLGVMELEDQPADWDEVSDESLQVDFTSMPTVGIDVEIPYSETGATIEWGMNSGGGISWKSRDTRFSWQVNDDGSQLRVEIDNSFLLAEFHLGGYVRAHLGRRADLYLGAGPSIMYGRHSVENEEDGVSLPIRLPKDSSSDLAVGFFVRAGLVFPVGDGHLLGFGVRYLGGEFDFDDTIGKLEIEGPQVLFTYTAPL